MKKHFLLAIFPLSFSFLLSVANEQQTPENPFPRANSAESQSSPHLAILHDSLNWAGKGAALSIAGGISAMFVHSSLSTKQLFWNKYWWPRSCVAIAGLYWLKNTDSCYDDDILKISLRDPKSWFSLGNDPASLVIWCMTGFISSLVPPVMVNMMSDATQFVKSYPFEKKIMTRLSNGYNKFSTNYKTHPYRTSLQIGMFTLFSVYTTHSLYKLYDSGRNNGTKNTNSQE